MNVEQTVLIPATEQSAKIIAFPVERRRSFIERVALALEQRQGRIADKFWRTECNRLYGQLQSQGLSDAAIRSELAYFNDAVQAELQRRAAQRQEA